MPLHSRPVKSRRVTRGFFACALLFSLLPVFHCIAAIPARTVTTYKVSSLGMTIGDATTSQQLSEEGGHTRVSFETKTRVKAALLWFGYQLMTSERGTLRDGELTSYSRKGEENGARIDSEGALQGGVFRFAVKENGTARIVSIPRSSYDYTTMECPEAFIDFPGRGQVTLRILDVENHAVVNREYRFVANTDCMVGTRKFPCRVVDLVDRNKRMRRWVNKDGNAIVVYRQESNDAKQNYSVQATAVTKEM